MSRVLVDLDRDATVLDAVERIGAAGEGDVVLVVPAGAPVARSAVFLDVARRAAGARPFAVVTPDARARSLATSLRVPAYTSVAALDRAELDPTERLDRARAAALDALPRRFSRRWLPALSRRTLAVGAAALAAVLVAAALAVPSASVTVAPTTAALGPLDLEVRVGPGAEVAKTDLSATVTRRYAGTATGARTEEIKAKGLVTLQNKRTDDIRIAKGAVFQSPQGVRFQSTEDRTLPRSVIIFPLTITVGTVDVPIEALEAGPGGNLPAGRISAGPAPNDYSVSNANPTTGGEIKSIPIVTADDYAVAQRRAAGELQAAAEQQLATWRNAPREGATVYPRVFSKLTSLTVAADVVGKEAATFDMTATGTANAYAYPSEEPSRSALARLRLAVGSGFQLDEPSARVDVVQSDVTEAGLITWKLRAAASQILRVDSNVVRQALAGRGAGEARAVVERLGLRMETLARAPAWWPWLPLLEGRISVSQVPASGGGR